MNRLLPQRDATVNSPPATAGVAGPAPPPLGRTDPLRADETPPAATKTLRGRSPRRGPPASPDAPAGPFAADGGHPARRPTPPRLAQNQFAGLSEDQVRWVGAIGADFGVIAVAKDSPYHTLKDLVAAVGARQPAERVGARVSADGVDQPCLVWREVEVEARAG